jgi:hypothetical protein
VLLCVFAHTFRVIFHLFRHLFQEQIKHKFLGSVMLLRYLRNEDEKRYRSRYSEVTSHQLTSTAGNAEGVLSGLKSGRAR